MDRKGEGDGGRKSISPLLTFVFPFSPCPRCQLLQPLPTMGIKNLLPNLTSVTRTVHLSAYSGTRAGVDAMVSRRSFFFFVMVTVVCSGPRRSLKPH